MSVDTINRARRFDPTTNRAEDLLKKTLEPLRREGKKSRSVGEP